MRRTTDENEPADETIRKPDDDALLGWHRFRAGMFTAIAAASIAMNHWGEYSAWLVVFWMIMAVSYWPCAVSQRLRKYERLRRVGQWSGPKPFAYWVQSLAGIALIGWVIAVVVRFVFYGRP